MHSSLLPWHRSGPLSAAQVKIMAMDTFLLSVGIWEYGSSVLFSRTTTCKGSKPIWCILCVKIWFSLNTLFLMFPVWCFLVNHSLAEFQVYLASLSEMVYINSIRIYQCINISVRQFLSQDDYNQKCGHIKCRTKRLKVIRIAYLVANIYFGI